MIRKKGFLRGFALIELLVVVSILVIGLVMVGPIITRLVNSQTPESAAIEVSAATDWARAEAVGKSTFVWMRIGPAQQGEVEDDILEVRVWISENGLPDGSPQNLRELRKPLRYSNIGLVPNVEPDAVGELRPMTPIKDRLDESGWLIFSPEGSVRTVVSSAGEAVPPLGSAPSPPVEIPRWLELGFEPRRGGKTTPALKKQSAVVQVAGLTGHTVVYR